MAANYVYQVDSPVNGPHFPEVTEQANHIGQLKEVETYDSAIHSILVA